MNEADGKPTETEKHEWLRWLIEDLLLLSSAEKLALLDVLNSLSATKQCQLLEILLYERRILDRLNYRILESERLDESNG